MFCFSFFEVDMKLKSGVGITCRSKGKQVQVDVDMCIIRLDCSMPIYITVKHDRYIAIERNGRMYMDCVSGASLVAFSNTLCEMIVINFVKSKIH